MESIRLRGFQILIAIVVIATAIGLGWEKTYGGAPDDNLSSRISQIVQQKRGIEKEVIIDFSTITSFEWDKLYVFRPYATQEQINAELGFEWRKAQRTAIGYSDQINLLVFVYKNKVVKYVEHERDQGDFYLSGSNTFDTNQARFAVQINYQIDPKGWPELHTLN